MTIKNKYEFGDSFFFLNDPEQREYTLVGLYINPGKTQLELSHCGDMVTAYEFEVTTELDPVKNLINGG